MRLCVTVHVLFNCNAFLVSSYILNRSRVFNLCPFLLIMQNFHGLVQRAVCMYSIKCMLRKFRATRMSVGFYILDMFFKAGFKCTSSLSYVFHRASVAF
jgi:hypothetical protein